MTQRESERVQEQTERHRDRESARKTRNKEKKTARERERERERCRDRRRERQREREREQGKNKTERTDAEERTLKKQKEGARGTGIMSTTARAWGRLTRSAEPRPESLTVAISRQSNVKISRRRGTKRRTIATTEIATRKREDVKTGSPQSRRQRRHHGANWRQPNPRRRRCHLGVSGVNVPITASTASPKPTASMSSTAVTQIHGVNVVITASTRHPKSKASTASRLQCLQGSTASTASAASTYLLWGRFRVPHGTAMRSGLKVWNSRC